MKIIKVDQDTPEWLELRKGKIMGSKLSDIYAKRGGKKIGFYQLIADKLAIEPEDEDPRDRGHRLEEEATLRFEKESGKKVDRKPGIWVSDDNEDIAVSPDGGIKGNGTYKEALEVKCFGDARHVQAYLTNEVPQDYFLQVLQYFIVNEDLEKLHLVFYTDRIPSMQYRAITVKRSDLGEDIAFYLDYEVQTLKEINDIIEEFAF